jgi:phosphoglycolate phosphatase-like HAD superfamily hydrolase
MFDASGIQLIIFDFDGVIVESNDIKDRVFKKIFSRFPEHADDFWQFHKTYISIPRVAKFEYVLEKMGRKDDTDFKQALLTEFSDLTLELMRSVSFVKGAKEFLKAINGKMPVYLASVTPIADLDIIVTHLQIRSLFTDVYGCPPWNKPDAIRDILQRENQSPDQTVLIGDSYGDQRAAKETGIHFIGRNSGLGFEDPQPVTIIPDLTGLLQILKIAD